MKEIQEIIALYNSDKPTTGDAECDRAVDRAVDIVLVKLRPLLRDIIRNELKDQFGCEKIQVGETKAS